jgi:hypothetical protein
MTVSADEIADALIKKMREEKHTLWMDPETHSQQHEFIQVLIDERAEKLRRHKALEDKVMGTVVVGSVLAVLGLIGAGSLDWLKEHIK